MTFLPEMPLDLAVGTLDCMDETGVMGAACRHEYPLCFLSLRHGERYRVLLNIVKRLSACHVYKLKIPAEYFTPYCSWRS